MLDFRSNTGKFQPKFDRRPILSWDLYDDNNLPSFGIYVFKWWDIKIPPLATQNEKKFTVSFASITIYYPIKIGVKVKIDYLKFLIERFATR